MSQKPISPACERNKDVILSVLQKHLLKKEYVVEIGSGTGQHCVYFAKHLPHITWQPTDRAENISYITLWVNDANLPNIKAAKVLDVNQDDWPVDKPTVFFTANTFHIMSWDSVCRTVNKGVDHLADNGLFFIYGPFNYNGKYTSESNKEFDGWLNIQSNDSAIRDFEKVCDLFFKKGCRLIEDNSMPANNRLLIFKKDKL